MAITTFSGPIRSLAGFVPAGFAASNDIDSNNATTLLRVFPTPATDAAGNPTGGMLVGHAGKQNLYASTNAAGVGTLTLPIGIQHVHCTSWYFKNHSQLSMYSRNLDFTSIKYMDLSYQSFLSFNKSCLFLFF